MFKIHNVKFKSTADLKTFLKRDLNTLLDTLYSKPDKEEYYAAVEDVIIALADIKVKDLKYDDFSIHHYPFITHFAALQYQFFKRLALIFSSDSAEDSEEYGEIKQVYETEDGRHIIVNILYDLDETDTMFLDIRPAIARTRMVTEYIKDTEYQS